MKQSLKTHIPARLVGALFASAVGSGSLLAQAALDYVAATATVQTYYNKANFDAAAGTTVTETFDKYCNTTSPVALSPVLGARYDYGPFTVTANYAVVALNDLVGTACGNQLVGPRTVSGNAYWRGRPTEITAGESDLFKFNQPLKAWGAFFTTAVPIPIIGDGPDPGLTVDFILTKDGSVVASGTVGVSGTTNTTDNTFFGLTSSVEFDQVKIAVYSANAAATDFEVYRLDNMQYLGLPTVSNVDANPEPITYPKSTEVTAKVLAAVGGNAIQTVEFTLDGGTTWTAMTQDGSDATLYRGAITSPLPGSYTVAVRATDTKGFTSLVDYVEDDTGDAATDGCDNFLVKPYDFIGFFAPVDNRGAGVINVAKAGRGIPLKFRTVDGNGVGVEAAGLAVKISVANLTCGLSTTPDQLEEYSQSASGLVYLGDGYYRWVWNTPTTYANSCKLLTLTATADLLVTQPVLQADFKFTK